MEDIIKLNVGGAYFTTTRGTLCAEPGSMLAAKFRKTTNGGSVTQQQPTTTTPALARDADGTVFLDRNPIYFKYILDYLRLDCRALPQSPKDKDLLEAIKLEADYFGLKGLGKLCSGEDEKSCKDVTEKLHDNSRAKGESGGATTKDATTMKKERPLVRKMGSWRIKDEVQSATIFQEPAPTEGALSERKPTGSRTKLTTTITLEKG